MAARIIRQLWQPKSLSYSPSSATHSRARILVLGPAPLELDDMNRFLIIKAALNLLTAPAPHVSHLDRVDPKLLPLVSARYV